MTLRRTSWSISPRLALGLLVHVSRVYAQDGTPSQRRVSKLAEGVYQIEHRDPAFNIVSGNTTVIVGDRQVFVVDAGFLPSQAREDIEQIRQWTNKPVAFLLNTHFHNDHNLANRAYLDAFPAVTIVAHVETKKDMDMVGPGSLVREQQGTKAYQQMLDSGKTRRGVALSDSDKMQLRTIVAGRRKVEAELAANQFLSPTLTFDHDFTIDIGNRVVQVKFMGRGNTNGDAVVYLPNEKIVMTGDLVVAPLPYMYDGYPTEWIQTLQKLAQLDANTIVPGHGPAMHDMTYVNLIRELLTSAVSQLNAAVKRTGPAMFHTVDDYKAYVDLTPFRARFAGNDPNLAAGFDRAAATVLALVSREASLR
jgi:cyclase